MKDYYEENLKRFENIPEDYQVIKTYDHRYTENPEADSFSPIRHRGTVGLEKSELDAQGLLDLYHGCEDIRAAYEDELQQVITPEQLQYYKDALKNWASVKSKQNQEMLVELKQSIYQYFLYQYPYLENNSIYCNEIIPEDWKTAKPRITPKTIESIVRLNEKYISQCFGFCGDSEFNGSYTLRRGIHLETEDEVNNLASEVYKERNFLSSYTLALSVAQRFAQDDSKPFRAIINGEAILFKDRAIACSLLNKELNMCQMEFVVFPERCSRLSLEKQSTTEEYTFFKLVERF